MLNAITLAGMENLTEALATYIHELPRATDGPDPHYRRMNLPTTTKKDNSLAGIRQQLMATTAARFDSFTGLSIQSLFILLPEQVESLNNLPAPRESTDFVKSINYLGCRQFGYKAKNLLQIIETMPPTSGEAPPDWKDWWLVWSERYLTDPDHQELDEFPAATAALRQVVAAMANEAAKSWPSAKAVLEFSSAKENSNSLANAYVTALCIARNATEGMKISPDRVPFAGMPAEEFARQLNAAGVEYEQDVGPVNDIADMKRRIGANGLDEIYSSENTGLWFRRSTRHTHLVDQQGGRVFELRPILRRWQRPPDAGEGPEAFLAYLIGPTPDEGPWATDLTKTLTRRHVAMANGMTPMAVQAFFDGNLEKPSPESHPMCPVRGQCSNSCGKAQRDGLFPFPLTYDGRFESCRYWAFLIQHGDQDPTTRRLQAELELDKEQRKKSVKPNRLDDEKPQIAAVQDGDTHQVLAQHSLF